MAEEVVAHMKKDYDLETCIKSFENRIKVLIGVVYVGCVLNMVIVFMLLMKN